MPLSTRPVSGRKKHPSKSGGGPKRMKHGKKRALPRAVPSRTVILAFLAGIAAMGGLWLLLDFGSSFGPVPSAKAPAVAAAPEKRAVPRPKPSAETAPSAKALPPAEKGPAARNGSDATIMRALVDMAGLPYEESLSAPFEERVKQADYALIQAMLRLSMRPAETVIETSELRHNRGGKDRGAYHFQRLRISVGADPLPFVTALHESLRAWAEQAELAQTAFPEKEGGPALWTISIGGVPTHELALVTGKAGRSPAVPARDPSPARILRQRRPGEPARMVLVMDDMGQSMPAARQVLALACPVTFAVWPDSGHARETARAAHEAGNEVIVHLPMEPLGYPGVKPGPNALMVGADAASVERTVRAALDKVPYAAGLNNHMGSRFTQDSAGVQAVLRVLREKNLMALDSLTHPASVFYAQASRMGLDALKRDVFLDVTAKKDVVLRQLRAAEKVALLTGQAIAIGHPLPETLAALKEWSRTRNGQVTMVRLADLTLRANSR